MLHVHRWKLTYPLKYYGWKMYFLLKLSLCRVLGDMLIFQWCTFLHPTSLNHPSTVPSKVPGASTILRGPKIFKAIGTLTTCDLRRRPHPPCDLQAGPWGEDDLDTHFFGPTKKKSAKIQTFKIHTKWLIYIIPLILIMHQQKIASCRHVGLNLLGFFLRSFF